MSLRENIRCKEYLGYLNRSPVFAKCAKIQDSRELLSVEEQVSTYVLAPALDSYVLWVLKDALKKGIRRLYFLARDGFFMYRAAEIFCRRFELPIECRYLCCSRYSVRIPVYHLDTTGALEFICRGGIDVTLHKILERSGIPEEEQKKVLKLLDLPCSETEVIPYAKLPAVREKLKKCQYFMECMCRQSRAVLPELKGYLEQEGLLEDVPDAIVDSGWVGSMQKTLNQVLSHFGRTRELEGYYWGLYELPANVKREHYHCYYFSPEKSLKEKVYFSNCLFESIYSAPHGMTTGYCCAGEGERYEPVYAPYEKKRKIFMELTEIYLMRYTRRLAESMQNLDEIGCTDDRRVVKKLLKLFMGHPTQEEAEIYGSLEFSDDVLESEKQQVAVPLSEAELQANHVWNKTLIMLGIRQGYIKESAWYEGSAARSGKHVGWHLVQYRMYKYLLYLRKQYLRR